MNYGYPKIGLYFRISIIHLRISLNHKKMMYMPKGYNDFSLVREWRHPVWLNKQLLFRCMRMRLTGGKS